MGEHAFPLMSCFFFASRLALHFGGSGRIMSTARPELPLLSILFPG